MPLRPDLGELVVQPGGNGDVSLDDYVDLGERRSPALDLLEGQEGRP